MNHLSHDHSWPRLGELVACLPELAPAHARTTCTYGLLAKGARLALENSGFKSREPIAENLGGVGEIIFPYEKMGTVDSLDLFGLDELILFSFYWINRRRYRQVADIGANLGLHSIVMAKCGWQVRAYEPDPGHARLLARNLGGNRVTDSVRLVEAAVSDRPGVMEFVRVLGNTTSSHLAGAKANAYGELERFPVQVKPIGEIMPEVDLVKLDAEGEERKIILGTKAEHWAKTDMIVEVGSKENAEAIYEHLHRLGVNAYAQKLGWKPVQARQDLPVSYKEGSLFISRRDSMPWDEAADT